MPKADAERRQAKMAARDAARDSVVKALENQKFEWRTLDGIAVDTELPLAQVRKIIEDLGDEVVRSSLPDAIGRSLYTTRNHYKRTHSLGSRILNVLSDKVA